MSSLYNKIESRETIQLKTYIHAKMFDSTCTLNTPKPLEKNEYKVNL